jgi:chemotaxis protein methyltransferase CheR
LVSDTEGVQFLQWCLPQLRLRWAGFRKIRRQVYRRISRRLRELSLASLTDYRIYLEGHPDEWATLDSLCWVSISRFYRDQKVFQALEQEILPQLAKLALSRGESELRCWSAGCSGGEEPYTLAIIWRQRFGGQFSSLNLRIIATDVDARAIQRAERACYQASSLKQLPSLWRSQAFLPSGDELCLKSEYRELVTFIAEDIRQRAPTGSFDLVLCRNLAFTYFDETSQRETLAKLVSKLIPGGGLVIGKLESLPTGEWELEPWSKPIGIYRKPVP